MSEIGRVVGKPWPKGVSGNPSGLPGRPVGSKTVFSQGFTRDLAEVWASHCKETMIKTAQDQPGVFFATCARLLPADVKLTIEQSYAGLSPEDYVLLKEVIAAVRQAIPNADSKPPGAVLEHVLSALGQAETKVIE
jgi:hypothetical protein